METGSTPWMIGVRVYIHMGRDQWISRDIELSMG